MISPAELLALVVATGFAVYVTGGLAGAGVALSCVGLAIVLRRVGGRLASVERRQRVDRVASAGALALLALALPFLAKDEFAISLLSRGLVLSLIVLSLNVVTGYTGQISIGHAALVGIGAYTSAIGAGRANLEIVLAVAAGALAAGFVGLLIGVPALRLRGHYLGMVTLAITVAFPALLQLHELEQYTGSFNGLSLFDRQFGPPVALPWLTLDRWYYFVTLAIVLCSVWLVRNLVASAAGRALVATRDHELAAASIGVNVAFAKVSAFVLSAILSGLAGGLWFILNNRSVAPDGFTLTTSVEFLLALVVGGRASILGSILGGFFLVYVYQQWVQAFSQAFGAGSGGWADWLVVATVSLIAAASLLRSRGVWRITPPLTRPATTARLAAMAGGKLVLALAIGFGVLRAFRGATESFLNVTALQPAFAGVVLVVAVLGAPGGLAALVKGVMSLTWHDVRQRSVQWFAPATSEAAGAGREQSNNGKSKAREEASWS